MKKLLIVFGLIIFLIASFFINYKMYFPIKVSKTQAFRHKSVNEKPINQPAKILPTPPEISFGTTTKNPPQIYDILGTSIKPKPYPNAAMTKWRNDVRKLSINYPTDLYLNGQNQDKVVALTFDDGPDPVNTPKIIKILRLNHVQGTFFCIGKQVEACKDMIKKAYEDGDVIASHTWSHKDLTKTNATGISDEVTLTENEIYKVTGKRSALIRPPFGAIDDSTLNSLTQLNYKTILWSIDTLDWAQRDADNIVRNVIENVRPGEIILMHCDGDKKTTTEALPLIILKLKEMGYSFVTVDKLLNIPAYKESETKKHPNWGAFSVLILII